MLRVGAEKIVAVLNRTAKGYHAIVGFRFVYANMPLLPATQAPRPAHSCIHACEYVLKRSHHPFPYMQKAPEAVPSPVRLDLHHSQSLHPRSDLSVLSGLVLQRLVLTKVSRFFIF